MSRCAGFKRDGTRCTATVTPPQTHCWWHDPAHAEQRKKAAAKGGHGKAAKATKALHALLEDLTERVVAGELETSRGAVASQLINTRIRLLEFERRARELDEVEERLAELEGALSARKEGGSYYGA